MAFMTLAEAAGRLGVSERQARNLARHGDLTLLARGVIDAESVTQYLRHRGSVATRVWNESTAWAAIHLLAGDDVHWLAGAQVSRLRSQLRAMDAAELSSRLRNRARVHRLAGHRSVAERLDAELVHGSRTIGDVSVARSGDGYLATPDLDDLIERFQLRADSAGAFTVRTTDHLDRVSRVADTHGDVLAAVDLSTSADARERSAALALLTEALATL